MKKVKVGIVGGSGYTGIELLRLLAQHPHAEIVTITGRKDAGTHVAKMFPSLRRSEERRVGKECRSRWSPYH